MRLIKLILVVIVWTMLKGQRNRKPKNCLNPENCLTQEKNHQKVGIKLIVALKRVEITF